MINRLKTVFSYRPILSIAILFIVALAAWSFWLEQTRLVIRVEKLEIENWAPKTPSMKIAVLSDLHVGSPYWGLDSLQQLVVTVNEQNPDMVVILGDYFISNVVGGNYKAPAEFAPILSKLSAPRGVFSVLGNHDWAGDTENLLIQLEKANITVLENSAVTVNWHGSTINLIGIADDSSRRPNLKAVLGQHYSDDTKIQVLMTHNPGIYVDMADHQKPTLMLAGHTHGGQVNFPFFGRLFVPSRAPISWAHGWTNTKSGPLFVTSGVGTSILPVRFNQPPEIVLLSLTSKPD